MSLVSNERALCAYNSFISSNADIISGSNYRSMMEFVQHGTTSCYTHSLAVAYYSLRLADRLRIRCDSRSMLRGALLHDYFLYDWHNKNEGHRLHGFRHPATALKNASAEFSLNPIEQNVIVRHMFPFVPMPPRYRESYIVSIADKFCSALETLRLTKHSKFYLLAS